MSINFIIIIYILAVQFMLYKRYMASLSTIMRIIGKIDFKKPTQLDKSNWVYRYSHPYIRVLGPKEATVYMNEINSPVSVDPKVHPWFQSQNRFNVPQPLFSPVRRGQTRPTEAAFDEYLKDSALIESELFESKKEKDFDSINSIKENNIQQAFAGLSPLQIDDKGLALSPRGTRKISAIKSVLQLPIALSGDNTPMSYIPTIFQSNSHFKLDGMILDMAISPDMRKLDGGSIGLGLGKFFSDKDSPNNLDAIEDKDVADSESIKEPKKDLAKSSIAGHSENPDKDVVLSQAQVESQEFHSNKHSGKRSNNSDKKPTFIDLKKKRQVGPLPFTGKPGSHKESKSSLANFRLPLEMGDDEKGVMSSKRDIDESLHKLTDHQKKSLQIDTESIGMENNVKEGTVHRTRLRIPNVQAELHSRKMTDDSMDHKAEN